MGSYGVDLVDQIFKRSDAVLSKAVLNESVVGKRDSLLVDFTISSLVNEFLDCFSGRISTIKKTSTRR